MYKVEINAIICVNYMTYLNNSSYSAFPPQYQKLAPIKLRLIISPLHKKTPKLFYPFLIVLFAKYYYPQPRELFLYRYLAVPQFTTHSHPWFSFVLSSRPWKRTRQGKTVISSTLELLWVGRDLPNFRDLIQIQKYKNR